MPIVVLVALAGCGKAAPSLPEQCGEDNPGYCVNGFGTLYSGPNCGFGYTTENNYTCSNGSFEVCCTPGRCTDFGGECLAGGPAACGTGTATSLVCPDSSQVCCFPLDGGTVVDTGLSHE
jgi:hypothetical protein